MLCCLFEALSIKAAPGFFSVASSASTVRSYHKRFSPMPSLGMKKTSKTMKANVLIGVNKPFSIFYVNVEFINQVL